MPSYVEARSSEKPRLCWMPYATQHAQPLVNGVVSQAFYRHNHGALHQIGKYLRVKDAHGGVVGGASEQRILPRMESGTPDGAVVVLKRLVGFRAEVEIEPH